MNMTPFRMSILGGLGLLVLGLGLTSFAFVSARSAGPAVPQESVDFMPLPALGALPPAVGSASRTPAPATVPGAAPPLGLGSTSAQTNGNAVPIRPGSLVFAPWGSRYYYPGTAVQHDENGWLVIFEDGDEAVVPAEQLHVGQLAAGTRVEFAMQIGPFEPGVVVSAVNASVYHVQQDSRDLMVQLQRLRIPLANALSTLPHAATARRLPTLYIAQKRGQGYWHPCSPVLDTTGALPAQVEVLYDDGSRETLSREHVRIGALRQAQALMYSSGRLRLTGDVIAFAGRAVYVSAQDRPRWMALSAIYWEAQAPPF